MNETSLLNIGILGRSIFLYCVFIAFATDFLPWYAVLLCNIVFFPALYLNIHDLGHGASSQKIGFTAYYPLVADPIWGGLRAFRYTHYRHHRFFGTYNDPWLPYYNGHPLKALFWNFVESEYNGYQYYRAKGLDSNLITSSVINIAMLAGNFFIFGPIYWIQVLSQRCIRVLAIFFFNYYTHRSGFSAKSDFGVYDREKQLRYLLPLLRFFWGRSLINGLIYHNRHHCIKNWNVPVKHYHDLVDDHVYTPYDQGWPAKEVRQL
jgi:fatty acid desaturase